LAEELSGKLFAVETGQYGAGEEKKALKAFSDRLKGDITASVTAFLEAHTDDARVGLITLPEISNTKATLYITELYLTITLNYAKTHPETFPRTLVVLEEAHTVIPEASTMGVADFDSRGLVGKITQIALQGRKYRVGLLVIAQRTATVSKSVLTQCNTIISFSCIDDTSIGFLTNVFGSQYAALLPSLPWLHAVAYGRAIRSERPLIVEIPYDEAKERMVHK
jgi:DNA helicase HerA-like ATPase